MPNSKRDYHAREIIKHAKAIRQGLTMGSATPIDSHISAIERHTKQLWDDDEEPDPYEQTLAYFDRYIAGDR